VVVTPVLLRHQQLDAQLTFQALDGLRQRRLAHMKPARGGGQAAVLSDSSKGP